MKLRRHGVSKLSLTLTLSQREKESFSEPLFTHTSNKTQRKFCMRIHSYMKIKKAVNLYLAAGRGKTN
ncbi:MAG TPA: hypothetical protein PK360_17350, partial [bacterium]|nr:hypothetical protein [bacterium]